MVQETGIFSSPAERHDHSGPQRCEQERRPTLQCGSAGSNFAPTSKKLIGAVSGRVDAYRTENGLSASDAVPADAVTASASGLDPDISVANARLQAKRVAAARDIPEQEVLTLLDAHTQARQYGLLGYPRVNVLELNVALDDKVRRVTRR
jgi:potassium-transporting ATPase KdpC subunit